MSMRRSGALAILTGAWLALSPTLSVCANVCADNTQTKKPSPTVPAVSATKKPQTRPSKGKPTSHAPTKGAKPAHAEKPLVFTDDDLKRYHSVGTSPSPTAGAANAPRSVEDPLRTFKDREERARWRQEKISELQGRTLDLDTRVKLLQEKRLSIQNPLLPRTTIPGEDPSEDNGLSGPELLQKTDKELREASQQLEDARKALASFLEKYPE